MTTHANTVLMVEIIGETMLVTPQGDAVGFRYHDIHVETNVLLAAIDRENARNLVVNFSHVGVIGSVMIGAILKLTRKMSTRNGQAAVCCVPPVTRSVIESMNLTRLWPLFETQEDAVESFD